ncbi:hypothetical protein EXT67_20575 [Pectobacterium atrosepticum]|nr:hypothetical protein [Pectobacterium atrosepticum]MCL6318701.1 hypothetical protein [Pectobacterium atrosepticum]MCL6408505.1 hypothetical protein [Dickeya dadantii]
MLHSINKEQKLYVMPCGKGFTCYGFEVLDTKARQVKQWLESEGQTVADLPYRKGTKKHYNACNDMLTAAQAYNATTGKRCPAGLTKQLKGLEGRRVEVITMYGEKRRFIVGRSTGWMPAHLEISRANSSGGMSAEQEYKSVTIVK